MIDYARKHAEVSEILVSTKHILEKKSTDSVSVYTRAIEELIHAFHSNSSRLKIAVVGEFSSGKSSILKALTGNEIEIGSGITTQKNTSYEWKGLLINDTPGVLPSTNLTDHDKLSKKATVSSDLLLFVITNELFNPILAEYLQYLIREEDGCLGLHAKTAICVNKMDRVLERDYETRVENIYDSIKEIIDPYSSIPVIMCSAEDYLEAVEEGQASGEEIDQFQLLEEEIDHFVNSNGIIGKLMTPLAGLMEILENVRNEGDNAKIVDNKKHTYLLISTLETYYKRYNVDIINENCNNLYNRIYSLREDYVGRLDQGLKEGVIESIMKEAIIEAEDMVEEMLQEVKPKLESFFNELKNDLEEVDIPKEVSCKIIEINSENLKMEGIEYEGLSTTLSPYIEKMASGAMKLMEKTTETLASDTEALRNFLRQWKNTKWRPWGLKKETAKWAGRIGKVSKAVPYISFAIDSYIHYREEKAEEEKMRKLAKCKTQLYEFFKGIAKDRRENMADMLKQIREDSIGDAIDKYVKAINQLSIEEAENKEYMEEVVRCINRTRALQSQISMMNKADLGER